MTKDWPEGNAMLAFGYRWIAERHQSVGSPMFVSDECCRTLEDVIEAAYTTHDALEMKKALNAFAVHMVGHFKSGRVQSPAEVVG
jgi:hypothetical protein